MELESRAIKGDYNPDSTKVLHFTRNPMSQAVERLQTDTNELQSENDALKARVKLLEEGQTKDITMMVGHRLEEGASSAEVLELNKQLESSNTKNQRIMDAFKQTSKDFREFVAETTGFKIEKRGQDTYKMKSVYAESASDYLLFLKTAESGVELLESDYMAELQDLLKLHIYKECKYGVVHYKEFLNPIQLLCNIKTVKFYQYLLTFVVSFDCFGGNSVYVAIYLSSIEAIFNIFLLMCHNCAIICLQMWKYFGLLMSLYLYWFSKWQY